MSASNFRRELPSKKEVHESPGVRFLLLHLFLHPLHRRLEEETDEVLVGGFRSNHAEGRDVLLTSIGRDDEERMPHALENIVAEEPPRPSVSVAEASPSYRQAFALCGASTCPCDPRTKKFSPKNLSFYHQNVANTYASRI